MLKKMIVLAMAVAALAAFAIPASASAANLRWAQNGVIVKEGINVSESFSGGVEYIGIPGAGNFGCETSVKLTVTGPEKAQIVEFSPKLPTCKGTGSFVKCTLNSASTNVPWDVPMAPKFLPSRSPGVTFFCPARMAVEPNARLPVCQRSSGLELSSPQSGSIRSPACIS